MRYALGQRLVQSYRSQIMDRLTHRQDLMSRKEADFLWSILERLKVSNIITEKQVEWLLRILIKTAPKGAKILRAK